jgi:hypothetical protein
MNHGVLATVLIAGLLLAGCSSFEPVDIRLPPAAPGQRPEIEIGDTVEVLTAHQGRVRFKVIAIDDDAISGEGVIVPRSEIESIAVKRFDVVRTAGFTGVTVLGVAIVLFVVSLAFLASHPAGIPL